MDFLKKHFEKILLGVAFVALIAVAGYLAREVTVISKRIAEDPLRPKPPGKVIPPSDTTVYLKTITGLQTPSVWPASPLDMFATETPEVPLPPTNITTTTNIPSKVIPFTLTQVVRQTFKFMFTEYTGDGRNFQVNLRSGGYSYIVPKVDDKIADRFGDTGYVVKGFSRKFQKIKVVGIGEREIDVSELTIVRDGEPPVVLVLNRPTELEPEAYLTCVANNQPLKARRGQTITCGGVTYKVVDITASQVLIENIESAERQFITQLGVKE